MADRLPDEIPQHLMPEPMDSETAHMLLKLSPPEFEAFLIKRDHIGRWLQLRCSSAIRQLRNRGGENWIDEAEPILDLYNRVGRYLGIQAAPPIGTADDEAASDLCLPPRGALFLLRCLPTSRSSREALIGDLQEEFTDVVGEQGERRARVWFWWMVLCSFGPVLKDKIPGFWGFVKRWVIR